MTGTTTPRRGDDGDNDRRVGRVFEAHVLRSTAWASKTRPTLRNHEDPPSNFDSRSASSSSAAGVHANSGGGLKDPSALNCAAGTGLTESTPSTRSLYRSSNAVTFPRSDTSIIPGAKGVGPSGQRTGR